MENIILEPTDKMHYCVHFITVIYFDMGILFDEVQRKMFNFSNQNDKNITQANREYTKTWIFLSLINLFFFLVYF